MKKGKSRNKRKKTRSRLLWIAIAVIGIAAVISAVCVAGMLATKENAWKTPEELLVEYMIYFVISQRIINTCQELNKYKPNNNQNRNMKKCMQCYILRHREMSVRRIL